jgi:diguanylate cyclase (GGDEF)-like protein
MMGRVIRWLRRTLLALAALCVWTAPAHADFGLAGKSLATCVMRGPDSLDPRAMFAHPERFDCHSPQSKFGSGDFWILSSPLGALPPGRLYARSGSLWQDHATLDILYGDGRIVRLGADGHAATRNLQLGAIFSWPLPVRGAKPVRLLWHVAGSANLRGILNAPRVANADQGARANLLLAVWFAAFGGLSIALLVYNLALWGALRHRFQPAYCAMVCMQLAYALSSSGIVAWAFPWIANNDRLRLNYLFLALAATFAIIFARTFFEERVFAGWLGRAATFVNVALLSATALVVTLAPWHIRLFDTLYCCAFLALMMLAPLVIWRAKRKRSDFLWLFAIAWAAPIMLGALRVAVNLRGFSWSFLLDNSTVISMTIEALLSSLAIAYRFRLLSRERDEAREQEIAARLLADTDPLTGLLNRRAFLSRAIGREDEQTLLIADIDHFKHVNDTIGHDGGDEVLRIYARVLRQIMPEGALIARFGGEEFAIVVETRRAPDPERILAALRAARMPFDLTVTASIGTCTGPLGREGEWKALYRGADRALYDAKSSGRDRARKALRLAA